MLDIGCTTRPKCRAFLLFHKHQVETANNSFQKSSFTCRKQLNKSQKVRGVGIYGLLGPTMCTPHGFHLLAIPQGMQNILRTFIAKLTQLRRDNFLPNQITLSRKSIVASPPNKMLNFPGHTQVPNPPPELILWLQVGAHCGSCCQGLRYVFWGATLIHASAPASEDLCSRLVRARLRK